LPLEVKILAGRLGLREYTMKWNTLVLVALARTLAAADGPENKSLNNLWSRLPVALWDNAR
jgi:hypothetical protein